MSEVQLTDLSRLLHSKRNESNAIVTSRKRKLRELFAVATHVESLPQDAFNKPDAPAPSQAEWDFLQANEILQSRKLNEQTIPSRQRLSLDVLHRSLAALGFDATAAAKLKQVSPPAKVPAPAASDPALSSKPSPAATPGVSGTAAPVKASTRPSKDSPSSTASHVSAATSVSPTSALETLEKTTADQTATAKTPTVPASSTTGSGISEPSQTSSAQRRPAQVSFPPGTKGSPSEIKDANESGNITKSGAVSIQGDTGTPSKKDAVPQSKIPTDVARPADALSSPGSTAPSAATPAIHDASTDTSPEKEELSYSESTEDKTHEDGDDRPEDGGEAEEGPTAYDGTRGADAKADDGAAAPGSAEDQLLQESIRSSAAAVSPNSDKVPSPVEGSTATKLPGQLKDDEPTLKSATKKPEPDKKLPEALAQSSEIPDSREETPEQMDVDTPEQIQDKQMGEKRKPTEAKDKSSATPKPPKIGTDSPQVAERAVTRVSSGAMRPKSVDEIVGGTSRHSLNIDRAQASKDHESQLTPVTSTPQSPSVRPRRVSLGRKDKQKGQISTVLFGKQPKKADDKALVSNVREASQPFDDYYTPLFVQGFAGSSSWMQPIEKILFHANKTLATPDANLAILDHQACKVLRRVYHLQHNDKWSLRQLKRAPEPTRPRRHWDVLLDEMKWMRTDFREEKKWKLVVAKNLAYACAEFWEASPDEKKALQVPAYIPPLPVSEEDISMADVTEDRDEHQPTPDLIPGDTESPQVLDELTEVFPETVAPSAIFSLQEDDVVFGLRRTPIADQLLEELPLYGAPLKVPSGDFLSPDGDPDAHWRRPALPLSKYVEGHMKVKSDGPPRKRSRYHYRNEDSDDEYGGFVGEQRSEHAILPPTTDEVALFNPEMKHIRDRLHAGHQFRPPTDHPMPTQSFYECRNPSMWTLSEDDELRSLVREYSYNWPLISSMLQSKSIYTSGAERRTPWECFERWINLEGLPSDMQRTQYFRAYNTRIEAAQRVIMQQNQLASQQANATGSSAPPVRRRQSTPLRVERRRNQKHLTMIDAMRKLAKKRETALQKQQQHNASQNAANKKPNEAATQRPNKTPREYSILRWERDQALAEKMAVFAQRQEANRRAAILQQRAQNQGGQNPGTPGIPGTQNGHHPSGSNGVAAAARPNAASQAVAAATAAVQARPRLPMQAAANGMVGNAVASPHMNGNALAAGQLNGNAQQIAHLQAMQAQHRVSMPGQQQPDANMMMRAQRISEQQRAAVQMQQTQHQHHNQPLQGGANTPRPTSQHSSPPAMANGVNGLGNVNGVNGVNGVAGISQQNFMNNAQAMMAAYNNAASGANHGSPQPLMHMNNAGSPGIRPNMPMPAAINNQLSQYEAQYRAKNPNLTPEQARQLATEHLTRIMVAQRQSAMSAAAGGPGQHGIANSIAATTSPHQYAALLRQQQQAQAQQQAQQQAQAQQQQQQQASGASQAASSPGQASHNRQSSESATPSAAH